MSEPNPPRKDRPKESYAGSTSIFQEFIDIPGGLPLDSPEVLERERLKKGRPPQRGDDKLEPPST